MKKLFLFLLAIAIAPLSSAGQYVTIQGFQLLSTTNGADIIRIGGLPSYVDPSQCATDLDSYMVAIDLSAEVKARIYSTLLAALVAGKSVDVYIDQCQSARPAIRGTALQ